MPATLADIQRKYGESVYPLYKDQINEPYMENDSGNGYKGVVLYDELEDKVQCAECGEWVKKITNRHLNMHEFESHKDYKDKYSLDYKTPLCCKSTSEKGRISALKASHTANWKKQAILNKKFLKTIAGLGNKTKANRGTTIQESNKIGLCDAQIESRWRIVESQVGHKPTGEDFLKYDSQLYYGIKKRYKSLGRASKIFGFKTNKVGEHYNNTWTDVSIIATLRAFVLENRHVPFSKEYVQVNFKPSFPTILKYFGSWRRAKMMAGLDQLLEELKNEKND